MKKGIIYFIIFIAFNHSGKNDLLFDYSLPIPQPPAAIGTEEDPQARLSYETRMLVNPTTGTIPVEIRKREVEFTEKIPKKSALAKSDHRILVNEYGLAGPFNVGGRTRALVLDSRDENVMIAGGVSGGIWKTTNGGTSWTRTSSPDLRNSITAIAQDTRPGKENNWYFTTGELVGNSARSLVAPFRGAGIYHSTDGGDSWKLMTSTADNASPDKFTSQFQYGWNIEVSDRTDIDLILTASYGGILKSEDAGKSWEVAIGDYLVGLDPQETDLNNATSPFYTALEKTSSGKFFAALSSATSKVDKSAASAGFYYSSNGDTWQDITPPALTRYHERTVIGVSKDETKVYFLTQGDKNAYLWLLEVDNYSGGSLTGTWTSLTPNIPAFGGNHGDFNSQGGYNMVLAVHPDRNNVVYLGGTNLYRSTDGFMTKNNTKWIGGYDPKNNGAIYPAHFPDQHLIVFYPNEANKMISGCDGGLRITYNNVSDSVSYASLNNGYITSQFYTIAQRKDKDTNEIAGGMQDNGTYLRDAPGENPSWNRVLGGDGGYCAFATNKDFVYVSFQNSQVYRIMLNSNNTIRSFARVDPVDGGGKDGENYLFINPFILDPWNTNRMFLTGGDWLWRNDNLVQIPAGSQTKTSVGWKKIEDSFISDGIYTSIKKSLASDILYAGVIALEPYVVIVNHASDETQNEIQKIKSPLFPKGGHISCIAPNAEDVEEFLVIFSNYGVPSVFLTQDGGSSFTDVSGNLEEGTDGFGYGPSVRWAEIIPTTSGQTYYLGTSTGLFSTNTFAGSSTVWVKEGEETIGNAVVTMMDYRDLDGRLVIATHGSGAFQTYIPDFRPFQTNNSIAPKLVLGNAYPNPFRDETTLVYNLPENGEVKIDIYDVQGKLINNILWGPQYAGENRARWNGTNTAGTRVKPGIYVGRLQYGGKTSSIRILLEP